MAKITFDFEALTVLSTASASPYWDQLRIDMNITLAGKTLGAATADLGFHGAGGIAQIKNLTPTVHTWPVFIDTADVRPNSVIGLNIQISNVRDMPTRDVERWVVALALAAAGGAVGVLLPIPKDVSKIALAAIEAGKGVLGTTISKIFEGLFKDPPECTGLAGTISIPISVDDVLYKPFEFEMIPTGFGVGVRRGVFRDSHTSMPVPMGKDCGTARYLLHFAYVHEETKIAPPPTATRRLLPVRGVPLDAWLGAWAEPTFGLPRAGILISRGSQAHADVLRVQVSESLKRYGGTKIVEADVDNRPVELGYHFMFLDDVWAELSPLAGAISDTIARTKISMVSGMDVQEAMADKSVEEEGEELPELQMVVAGAAVQQQMQQPKDQDLGPVPLPVLKSDGISPSIKTALFQEGVGRKVATIDEADTIFLPDQDISIALYEDTLHDGKGGVISKDYVIRYSRSASLRATRTDAILVRPMTIK